MRADASAAFFTIWRCAKRVVAPPLLVTIVGLFAILAGPFVEKAARDSSLLSLCSEAVRGGDGEESSESLEREFERDLERDFDHVLEKRREGVGDRGESCPCPCPCPKRGLLLIVSSASSFGDEDPSF